MVRVMPQVTVMVMAQVMVMGGHGEEHSVMKLVLGQNNWYSVPPMSYPRVQVTSNHDHLHHKHHDHIHLHDHLLHHLHHLHHHRHQHGCTAVTLNGRPGVVVSGGVDSNQFNTTR